VVEFEWDDANRGHLKRHRVTPEEFEQGMRNASLELESEEAGGEERISAAGMTDKGRLLFFVWTPRNGKVRAVTAFNAPREIKQAWKESR
jgi:uncharacterized DUF497 family protein